MNTLQILTGGKPLVQAERALILLHGRGGTAEGIISLANEFCDDTFHLIAPQAEDSQRYPFTFLAPEEKNEPWLTNSVNGIKSIITEIEQHIPAANIYIMGFSQGACMSLETTARFAQRYAGVAAFSGGLIGNIIRAEKYSGSFDGTPVFIGNSDMDPHIPLSRSRESAELIRSMGANVTFKVYPGMSHTITREEIETVKKLIFAGIVR